MQTFVTMASIRQRLMEQVAQQVATDLQSIRSMDWTNFFGTVRPMLGRAALAAYEADDSAGPHKGSAAAIELATRIVDLATMQFRPSGMVTDAGDQNTPYFCLTVYTWALLSLQKHVDPAWHRKRVDDAVKLFADAAKTVFRTHDYLNPRGMEAVGALGLYRLTGDRPYLDRATECLDQLLTRQYACGAQPYHTGLWIWGRKPAQGYALLTASQMLYLGYELKRTDAVEYVRRLMDFTAMACNRHGEPFVTTFEGLHKANARNCIGRLWAVAASLRDEKFAPLARSAYGLWTEGLAASEHGEAARFDRGPDPLLEAMQMGVREQADGPAFVPKPGRHVLADISTVLVHEKDLDISMTLLSGYSALAEADCGQVKLFALTPELTDAPTYRNAGTDALRADWTKPSEQEACTVVDGKTVLSGRVYTKWEIQDSAGKDFSKLHNRRLDVTMTYQGGDLVLEYHTRMNWQKQPVPSRLLFMLIARPGSASPTLQFGDGAPMTAPAADATDQEFLITRDVQTVRFTAPDGSYIEIVPELCTAKCIVAERQAGPHMEKVQIGRRPRDRKPANEGSLRLAFEGPDALDRGRYRIRFQPAPLTLNTE